MMKQMENTYPVAKPVVSTTTLNLKAGDVIQNGNMFTGFWTNTILEIQPSPFKKSRMAITFLTERGGIYTDYVAKNTHWSVVKSDN